jgi:hypothetical protein
MLQPNKQEKPLMIWKKMELNALEAEKLVNTLKIGENSEAVLRDIRENCESCYRQVP